MKKFQMVMTAVLLLFGILSAYEDPAFDDYFVDKTMRVDYFHIGDAKEETITIDRIYEQGIWAGSKKNLLDRLDYGRYCIKIYDVSSGKLIFSKGFDSYFGEYKTTGKALKGLKRTYHESFLLPYPKGKIRFSFEARDKTNVLHSLFTQEINPSSVDILRERAAEGVKCSSSGREGTPMSKWTWRLSQRGIHGMKKRSSKKISTGSWGCFSNRSPIKAIRMNSIFTASSNHHKRVAVTNPDTVFSKTHRSTPPLIHWDQNGTY